MTEATATQENQTNNINVAALAEMIEEVKQDPQKGMVKFQITSEWKNQTRMESKVDSYFMAGKEIKRSHTIISDEPFELLGSDSAPNPQELLFAALNSCMMVGYVVGAAVEGITLDKLEIQTEGELDLRGFLNLDASIKPGYETIKYTVRIKGNGTREQFQAIHDQVIKTSVNRFNIANPINLDGRLRVE